MVSQSSPLDDPATFRALMIECHMPPIQIEHIVTSGYTTIALLAHGVHDESKMEEFVEYLSLILPGENFVTFSPQSASIRRVLKECIARRIQSGRDSTAETSTTSLVKSKLSMVDVKSLRADFCQNLSWKGLLMATARHGFLGKTVHQSQMNRPFWNTDALEMRGSFFVHCWQKGNQRFMTNLKQSSTTNSHLRCRDSFPRFTLNGTGNAGTGTSPRPQAVSCKIFGNRVAQTEGSTLAITFVDRDFGRWPGGVDSGCWTSRWLQMVIERCAEWSGLLPPSFSYLIGPKAQTATESPCSASQSFQNPFQRSRSLSPKHPPPRSLQPPLGRIPNGTKHGWRNSVMARASASDSTLANASQANNVVMHTNAQLRKRMERPAGDSTQPQGTRSLHTDRVLPLQGKMHVIQWSLLQNFYHRLWFQSPRHHPLQVLKVESFHRRVQPCFLDIFSGASNRWVQQFRRYLWTELNRLTWSMGWTFWRMILLKACCTCRHREELVRHWQLHIAANIAGQHWDQMVQLQFAPHNSLMAYHRTQSSSNLQYKKVRLFMIGPDFFSQLWIATRGWLFWRTLQHPWRGTIAACMTGYMPLHRSQRKLVPVSLTRTGPRHSTHYQLCGQILSSPIGHTWIHCWGSSPWRDVQEQDHCWVPGSIGTSRQAILCSMCRIGTQSCPSSFLGHIHLVALRMEVDYRAQPFTWSHNGMTDWHPYAPDGSKGLVIADNASKSQLRCYQLQGTTALTEWAHALRWWHARDTGLSTGGLPVGHSTWSTVPAEVLASLGIIFTRPWCWLFTPIAERGRGTFGSQSVSNPFAGVATTLRHTSKGGTTPRLSRLLEERTRSPRDFTISDSRGTWRWFDRPCARGCTRSQTDVFQNGHWQAGRGFGTWSFSSFGCW